MQFSFSFRAVLGICAAVAIASTSQADTAMPDADKTQPPAQAISAQDAFRLLLRSELRRTVSVDKLHSQILRYFTIYDNDNRPGLSENDFSLKARVRKSRNRAQHIAKLLAYDLNGDLEISRDELVIFARPRANKPLRSGSIELAPTDEQKNIIIASFIDEIMQPDTNGDQILSIEEINAAASKSIAQYTKEKPHHWPVFHPAMDTNKDGVVSKQEVTELLEQLSAEYDPDHNGEITKAEATAFQRKTEALFREQSRKN